MDKPKYTHPGYLPVGTRCTCGCGGEIHVRETRFGFEYGSAKVERCMSDTKAKWVILSVETPKETLHIYVTKTGKVRVYNAGSKEWTRPEKEK